MAKVLVSVKLLAISVLATGANGWPPRTTTTTTSTEAPYFFEGVDYDQMPQSWQDERNDCNGEFLRCIRSRTMFPPICAYHISNGYYREFYHICELYLQMCRLRVVTNLGVFGTSYTNDKTYFNGEEHDCTYYYRRVHNSLEMDILYSGVPNPPYRSKPTPELYLGS